MDIGLGQKGKARLRLVQLHRLLEFEQVFTAYLEGRVRAEQVTERAKKMLAVGLPRFK